MKTKVLVSLTLVTIFISGILYINQSPQAVLIAVPDDFRGKLTIRQDTQIGKQPEARALENYGDYVYEFPKIENRIVYVKEISPIINARDISVSKINVAPLNSKLVSKNEKENAIVIEIGNWE